MNAQPRPLPAASASTDDTPLLRTLLLTDLCDSTEITEKRGDTAAAQIFRDLDRVVLELQQRWRGRLIDRSDGLLLLFERPIDGLGFALDYMKALKGVGVRHGVELRARAGLHVGEVLTWRNSVEAVQLGAKPLEVEGLTKPMAARLMTLARPGQILVSAIAEPLAHRAARELGERGEHLLWKSHGHWCFKGVPGKQEVHEVGEAGLAPLRMPKNGPKAWRDLPLWRRPASLVAEAVLLAGLGIGGWYAMKPEPAIAFGERDWVVMGDLRNLTGDPRLDESLEQAFRISLEQSRYVNVLSDLKARETLQRMQKPEGTAIDRAIASEIAVRDGVRAVILPMVSEVGGRLRVSAEVVDPRTQSTVYALSADGKGIGSVLDSVDEVTGELRGKLGEALAAIDKDSKPLPQVTTSNIDALKAYALGDESFAKGNYDRANIFYQRALELDSKFALAYIGELKVANATGRASEGFQYLKKALDYSENLTSRDHAYLQGWRARMLNPGAEAEAWLAMARQYPDDFRAVTNSGYLMFSQGRYQEAAGLAGESARPQNPSFGHSLILLGDALLALGKTNDSLKAYERVRAEIPGLADVASLRILNALASARNFEASRNLVATVKQNYEKVPPPFVVGYYVAQGNFAAANREADLYAHAQRDIDSWNLANQSMIEALNLFESGKRPGSFDRKWLEQSLLSETSGYAGPANDQKMAQLCAAYVAFRAGDKSLGHMVVDHYQKNRALVSNAEVGPLWAVVAARAKLAEGDAGAAQRILQSVDAAILPFQGWVTLADVMRAQKDDAKTLEVAKRLAGSRGQAFSELACGWRLQPLNVADAILANLTIAEIQQRRGDARAADEALRLFDKDWPTASLGTQLRVRRRALPTFN